MAGYTFNQLIDFTRTSAATYVDATGRIVPTPASRNLLTFTQEFDNAGWVKNDTTITANAATAPDGTLTADKLVENTANAEHRAARTETLVAGTYTLSCYVKAAERGFFVFRENINGSIVDTFFNLNTGVVASTGAGRTSSITSAGNGWYRCAVTATSTGGSATLGFDISDNGARIVYTGTAGLGIYLWGAQLEAASTASDYTRNNGGVYPPRFDYDPVTLAPKGLLVEEQRTNLVTYSEQFDNVYWTATGATVTANSAVSPDGTADADSLVEDTGTSTHRVFATPSCSASTTYTYTVYVKAAGRTQVRIIETTLLGAIFDLSAISVIGTDAGVTASIQDAGNGWRRCRITATTGGAQTLYVAQIQAASAGNQTYTGNGTTALYLWGAQLEAGSFATSYIPTVASQVTRTADVATITGANFSQWYNQSEGTFVAQFDMIGGSAANTNNQIVLSPIADASNRHIIYNGDAEIAGYTVVGGVTQAYLPMGSLAANTTSKMAYAYQVNNFAASQNGGAVSTDTSGSLPVPTRLGIGSGGLGGNQLNGHIRSIRYYPTRLSNAQLQALTA